MGGRRRWAERSWRARLGWVLLSWALLVVCVGLPVWAVASGDLNEVAGWANILALPMSALGLVLLLVEDEWGAAGGRNDRRRPWMAPPLDRMVERPELGERLVAALTAPSPSEVGLTTGLQGAGGFGKTWLATWACHRPEIDRRYAGGLLWVTVGQEVHGADLAGRINDLTVALGGDRPAISDPDAAGAELGRLLDGREPVLLVVDDVWEEAQLRPFRFGGRTCTRLVTTRIPDLLPPTGARIPVDTMSDGQARRLVADGVPGLPTELTDRLASLAGRWPVLLNLVNAALRRRVARGQPAEQAAEDIAHRLVLEGPAAFDPARPADRSRAVAATVEASLALLVPADHQRCLDLAIFPEDVEIPLTVLRLLWGGPVETSCDELVSLGLVADYRLDPPGPRLVLHDVMRAYLRTRRTAAERTDAHRRLVFAATGLLPGHEAGSTRPWWLLPADADYLWRHLPYHLHQAGLDDELVTLLCDLRWAEAKTGRFGSAVAVEADLELVDTPTTNALQRALRQAGHLLGPIDPPAALGATLASWLRGIAELEGVVDRYRATLPRPRLELAPQAPGRSSDPVLADAASAGHIGGVTSCAFSPDGTVLATTSDDGTARLWHVADGTTRGVLGEHMGGVWGCAFSADGALLATASEDRTVRLWQAIDGTAKGALHGHTDWVTAVAFSPDGRLLASTSQDGTARLWRVADGTQHTVLTGHTGRVKDCTFSPDGTLLATAGSDGTVRLWRVRDGTQRNVLAGHAGGAWCCAFAPNGELLAAGCDDGTVRLWRVADAAAGAVLTGFRERVWGCAFSPDGALVAATSWRTARLWQVASGVEQAVLTGHTSWVWGCAFSPDGALLATAGNDQTARLWHVATGSEATALTGRTRVSTCAFSPDGSLLATTHDDGTTRLTHVATGRQQVLTGHTGRVNHCAFSYDGTLLATVGNDQTARLWRVGDGSQRTVLAGHTGVVNGCGFSPDGTLLATGGSDCTVRLWRVADRAKQAVLTGHTRRVKRCRFSPDGSLLATASSDGTARLWRVADGTTRAVLTGHGDLLNDCAFSPDGTLLATTSDDRTTRLWRVADGARHAILSGHASWVDQCAFSPDGTLLATASNDGTVRLWQMASGRCLCALRFAGPMPGIAWHPSAPMLCTVGGAGAYLLTYQP